MSLRETCLWSLALTTALLAPMLLTTEYYWGAGQDLVLNHHPIRQAGFQALRSGEWPLWYPYLGTGLPFQTGLRTMAYPWHALGLFVDAGVQLKLSIFGHLFLAIFFMSALLSWLGMSRPSCLIGGLTYGGSGFFFGHLYAGHIDWIEPIAYLPGVFWAVLGAFRYRGAGWTVVAAAAIGWLALAGHYQPVYLTVLGVSVLLVTISLTGSRYACQPLNFAEPWARLLKDRRDDACPWTLSCFRVDWASRRRDLLGFFHRFFLMGSLALGLLAFRLLPSVQSLLASNRLLSADDFSGEAPAWQTLFTYLLPHFFEGKSTILCWSSWPSWEAQGYLGVAALGLAAVAFLGRREEWFGPGLAALFCFVMSLGANTPLYTAWKAVDPLLQNFRAPGRFGLILTFFAGWLAALGWELLQRERVSRRKAVMVSLIVGVPVLLLVLWLHSQGSSMQGWAKLVHSVAPPAAWSYLLEPHADNLTGLLQYNQTGSLFALGVAAATTLIIATRGPRTGMIAVLVVLFDLVVFASPYLKTAPPAAFTLPSGVVSYLSQQPESRVLWERDLNWYGRFGMAGLSEATAYDYFLAPAYVQAVNIQDGAPLDRSMTLVSDGDGGPLWDVLGVRYLIRRTPLSDARYRLETQVDGWLIYKSESALPRAFLVEKVEVLPTQEVLKLAGTDPGLFADTAFLNPEQPGLGQTLNRADRFAPVSELELSFNSVRIQAENSRPAVLVLNDTPWPGWSVSVDGQPASILSLNGGLHRGVELPPGRHLVEFRYWPRSLSVGIVVSLLWVLLCLLLARPWVLSGPGGRSRRRIPSPVGDTPPGEC
ncbi:MAG: hypothetical protein WC314_21445 [Vulcanimicrobiota bacterium]